MTSDLDIYRTASVLIREHGEDAALEAIKLANHFLDVGDMEPLAVWRRVLAALREIQQEEPGEDEAVN